MTCGMCLNIYMCLKVMQIVGTKRGRKFRELCFLCQQRLSVNSCAWCNPRANPETPTAHMIYWSELHLHILRFSKSVIKSQLRIQLTYVLKTDFSLSATWKAAFQKDFRNLLHPVKYFSILSYNLKAALTFKCETLISTLCFFPFPDGFSNSLWSEVCWTTPEITRLRNINDQPPQS